MIPGGSCIELAILRLQTCAKHRRAHSHWQMYFFDAQGIHDSEQLNLCAVGDGWNPLTLASANSLREELERVAKALASPDSGKAPKRMGASLAPSEGQYGRLARILKALRSVQSAWDRSSDASKARVQQSVVLFTARLSDDVPELETVGLCALRVRACIMCMLSVNVFLVDQSLRCRPEFGRCRRVLRRNAQALRPNLPT